MAMGINTHVDKDMQTRTPHYSTCRLERLTGERGATCLPPLPSENQSGEDIRSGSGT